ncbi:MAG: ABC transporter permease [Polaromonas sp.]|uniref:ABC transporter permease n=1 Tax=Polaromonas sp. TaxID=1869339 RepID=UPI0025F72842|nr:ABC transporter permease [Polaromonas sp.]MBI2728717.1 ABC transporter permease [Polaromonas sp.]
MNTRQFRIYAWQIGILVVALGSWELCVATGFLSPFWASSPSRIALALVEVVSDPLFPTHVGTTLLELVAGFAAGSILGIAIGFVLAQWPLVEKIFDPFLHAINSLPRVALAPLFILWLGIGLGSKILIAATLVVFIVIGNTLAAARSVDADMMTAARLLGATRLQLFLKVVLPASIPVIFAGLRLGVVYAMLGAVVGEMIAATSGLGYMLSFFAGSLQVGHLMATLVVLVVLSTSLSALTSWVERRILDWGGSSRKRLAARAGKTPA